MGAVNNFLSHSYLHCTAHLPEEEGNCVCARRLFRFFFLLLLFLNKYVSFLFVGRSLYKSIAPIPEIWQPSLLILHPASFSSRLTLHIHYLSKPHHTTPSSRIPLPPQPQMHKKPSSARPRLETYRALFEGLLYHLSCPPFPQTHPQLPPQLQKCATPSLSPTNAGTIFPPKALLSATPPSTTTTSPAHILSGRKAPSRASAPTALSAACRRGSNRRAKIVYGLARRRRRWRALSRPASK